MKSQKLSQTNSKQLLKAKTKLASDETKTNDELMKALWETGVQSDVAEKYLKYLQVKRLRKLLDVNIVRPRRYS